MKESINSILIGGLAILFLYGVFSSGRSIYRSYQDQKKRKESLSRFLSQLPQMGFQRLPPASPEQEEVHQVLNRYYVLRNTKHPVLELKATSAFGASLSPFPAYFLIVYEKISFFGSSVGAGGRSSPSAFQGTVVAVRMPLTFPGRTMIYRRPEPGESDNWDWFADAPLLGSRSYQIEEGLSSDFNKEFFARSTNKTVALPRAAQEFLLKDKALFVNTVSRRSALVFDEHGWGFVSDIIIEEELLKNLMSFQKDLTRVFKGSGT